jgi:Leucine-rich repeat (LRR) protein
MPLGISLFCKGLNATADFDFSEDSGEQRPVAANDIGGGSGLAPRHQLMLAVQVLEVSIQDSEIDVLRLQDFALLKRLQHLRVTRSKVRTVVGLQQGQLHELHGLDLSENNIAVLDENVSNLNQLRSLNLSRNFIQNVTAPFERMENLEELDLSSNRLSSSLNPQVLISLPRQLKTLDIWSKYSSCFAPLLFAAREAIRDGGSHVPQSKPPNCVGHPIRRQTIR